MLNENSKTGFETFTKIQKVQFFFFENFSEKKISKFVVENRQKVSPKETKMEKFVVQNRQKSVDLRDTPGF